MSYDSVSFWLGAVAASAFITSGYLLAMFYDRWKNR